MKPPFRIHYGIALVQSILLGTLDLSQQYFGKPKRLCVYLFLARFAMFFGLSYSRSLLRIFAFADLIFVGLNTVSWVFNGTSATIELVSLLDISGVVQFSTREIVSVCSLIIVVLVLVLFPYKGSCHYSFISFSIVYIALQLVVPFFMQQTLGGFFPESFNQGDYSLLYQHPKLLKYLETPFKILSPGNGKNLVIMIVESMEVSFLGSYSRECKEMMPFLTNLTRKGFFYDNMAMQPHAYYSAAGAMASTCGIPLIRGTWAPGRDRNSNIFSKHTKCMGHYLNKTGYFLRADLNGCTAIHGFQAHLANQGFGITDSGFSAYDREKFQFTANTTIPLLKNLKRPWVLFLNNENTHMVSYRIDKECKTRIPQCHMLYQTFDCVDQSLEWIYQQLEENGLLNNTEVMIYGDHLHMYTPSEIDFVKPRKMALWIPTQPPHQIKRPFTQYDIAPTILDILGVKYEPEFPFGASAFSEEPTEVPTKELAVAMKNYYKKELYMVEEWAFDPGANGFTTIE